MTLRFNPDKKNYRCLQHQQDWDATELLLVMSGEKITRECPECVNEVEAVYAEEIDNGKYCVVHDGRGDNEKRVALHKCLVCGHRFCAECCPNARMCRFCEDFPPTKTKVHQA